MDRYELLKLPPFERALTLASVMHGGQKDKSEKPYVMHVIRVMMSVEGEDRKIIALLHDLLEDTSLTEEGLFQLGFSAAVVRSVMLLTRDPKDTYLEYIRKLSEDENALQVKLSDLNDNRNRTRLKKVLQQEDLERLEKYHRAEELLLEVLHRKE